MTRNFRRVVGLGITALMGLTPVIGLAVGIENGVTNTAGVTVARDAPVLTGKSKIILTVDQYGNLSSTNAIATSADLASVAASNQLAIARQEATAKGYTIATNLINEVAASIGSSPIIFSSAELSSFIAATVFDELTSKLRIFEWTIDSVVSNRSFYVDGVSTNIACQQITCGYMFTSDIQTIQPLVKYVETLEGTTTNDWNYLNTGLVDTPTAVEHDTYTDSAGTIFSNFYEMKIWVPEDRTTGFFRVIVQNSTASAEGNTLDTVGVTGGATGTYTNGTIVLNVKGGYIMKSGTGYVGEIEEEDD